MTLILDLPTPVENALTREAQRRGTTPERLALDDLSRLYPEDVEVSSRNLLETPDVLVVLLTQFQDQDTRTQTDPGRDAYLDSPVDDILTAKYRTQGLTFAQLPGSR
jgi:hypothetical protein